MDRKEQKRTDMIMLGLVAIIFCVIIFVNVWAGLAVAVAMLIGACVIYEINDYLKVHKVDD